MVCSEKDADTKNCLLTLDSTSPLFLWLKMMMIWLNLNILLVHPDIYSCVNVHHYEWYCSINDYLQTCWCCFILDPIPMCHSFNEISRNDRCSSTKLIHQANHIHSTLHIFDVWTFLPGKQTKNLHILKSSEVYHGPRKISPCKKGDGFLNWGCEKRGVINM